MNYANNEEKSKRAKARWTILRKALLHNRADNYLASVNNVIDHDESEIAPYSIHRFEGFKVFQRNALTITEKDKFNCSCLNDPNYKNYEIIEYKFSMRLFNHEVINSRDNKDVLVKVRTREKMRALLHKVNIMDLMSHEHYGIDNTGNTCVWDCSSVLAYCVTSCPSPLITNQFFSAPIPFVGFSNILSLSRQDQRKCRNKTRNKRLRVIELGAGMASIPILSLAAVALSLGGKLEHNDMPFLDCVITDGHPKAVENNIVCSNLTFSLYNQSEKNFAKEKSADMNNNVYSNSYCAIRTHPLLWKGNDEGVKDCIDLLKLGSEYGEVEYFDLVLASDCIHFTQFHAGLISTIGRLLRVNGYCLLCQPKRGSTLDQFIQMINVINHNDNSNTESVVGSLFDVKLHLDFDENIKKKHKKYSEIKYQGYDENIHYPVVLVLQKLRSYNEDVDTAVATKFMSERDKKLLFESIH